MVAIGSGPIRIGQGIEFDYGCVHAVMAIRSAGMDAVLINNNPETVSTDFDTSDRLYFDPLTSECVSEILLREKRMAFFSNSEDRRPSISHNRLRSVSNTCPKKANVQILGTSVDGIDEASDRERFRSICKEERPTYANGATGTTADDIRHAVEEIGFPVLIRPSYVLVAEVWRFSPMRPNWKPTSRKPTSRQINLSLLTNT